MERPFPAYKGEGPYVFVSYSHDDVELVYPEIARLKDAGFNIWYDEGITPGATWRDEVALALTQCKVFLFYITPRSVASSNCLKEVNFSLSRERKILSVHLEPTELPIGLELSLSDMQAIIKPELGVDAFHTKLTDALHELMPRPTPAIIDLRTDDVPAQAADRRSIAVLPLVNRNLDAADDYLSDGIAEELINGLGKIEGLKVASQIASFRFRDKALDLKAVGDQLGVGSILSGSLQRGGNRIRINVRLDDVGDGAMLWSNRYDGEMDDIFDLQDAVARQVVEALEIELGGDESEQLMDTGTRNVEAYNAYLLGKHLAGQRTRRSIFEAKEQFEAALRLDVNFEEANFAAAQNLFWGQFHDPALTEETAARFERAAAAGLLDRPLESYIRGLFPSQSPGPLGLAQEALGKLRGSDAAWKEFAYWQIADSLAAVGALRGALAYFTRYKELSGLQIGDHPRLDGTECMIYAALGDFDRAIEVWDQRIELAPDDPMHVGERLLLYCRTGQYEKAETELEKVNKVWPRNFPQFYYLYWRREMDAAKAYFGWLGKRANLDQIYKIWGFALVGDIEQSLDHLGENALAVNAMLVQVQIRRVLPTSIVEEIEHHPRYQALLTRLGIDDDARQQLLDVLNAASDLTGIQVSPDEAY